MIKRWLIQAALALALILLGTFTYWSEYIRKPEKEAAEEASKKVGKFRDVLLDSMTISDGGKGVFEFKCVAKDKNQCKSGGQYEWQVVGEKSLKADKAHVGSLLSSVINTSATDILDLTKETEEKRKSLFEKEYGLGEKERKERSTKYIELKTQDGKKWTIYFGAVHPIGEKIFTVVEDNGKLNDEHVLLFPSYFKSNFEHDLNYWRDKTILDIKAADVASFELKSTKDSFLAEKKDGKWSLKNLKDPSRKLLPGDSDSVDNYIRSLGYLNAESIAAENVKDSTANKLLAQAKQFATLKIGNLTLTAYASGDPKKPSDSKLYVVSSASPVLFELKAGHRNKFEKALKDLRVNKLITSVERFSTKKIEIAGASLGKESIVAESDDSKWKFTTPKSPALEERKITKLLDKLNGKCIDDYIDKNHVPRGEDQGLRLKIFGESGEVKHEFAFWKSGESLYAKDLTSSDKDTFKLENRVKDILPWTSKQWEKGAKESKKQAEDEMPQEMPEDLGDE